MSAPHKVVSVLIIDDDEDDYLLAEDLLTSGTGDTFTVEWLADYDSGLEALGRGDFDVCFLDYHIGERDGLRLLEAAREQGAETPVIILTGDVSVDLDALALGADDYVNKADMSFELLERSIRYSIERRRRYVEARRARVRLSEIQHLESLGALAGGVAHEINNLLAIILANTEFLAEEVGALGDDARDAVKDMEHAALRGGRLTRQLLGFGRRERLVLEALDMNEWIDDRVEPLRRMMAREQTLEFLPAEGALTSKIDQRALTEVLVNLVVNASEAMAPDGKAEISVSQREFDEAFVERNPGSRPGEYVVVSVSDDGCGMEPEVIERAFEPFFTTKSAKAGSGLGLAVAFGLTKQHGGYVILDSEPERGTRVSVCLPLEAGPESAETAKPRPNGVPTGTETILIVEDEEALGRVAERLLARMGYRPILMTNPVQALELYKQDHSSIDLILSDVVMPEMTGVEMVENAIAAGLKPRVLFMSGYSSNDLRHGSLLDTRYPLLQKPFGMAELGRHVRSALDGPDD